MMVTTHTLVGMTIALPILAAAPEFAPAAFVAGLVGGLAPDLYAGHRRTLHYPVYASVAAAPAIGTAFLVPSTATVALGVGLAAAALHAVTDAASGGLDTVLYHDSPTMYGYVRLTVIPTDMSLGID